MKRFFTLQTQPLVTCLLLTVSTVPFLATLSRADSTQQAPQAKDADAPPVVVSRIDPVYPAGLRAQRIKGKAIVEFLVLPDGSVSDAKVVESSQPEFGPAAVEAVSQWRFKPGLIKGQPITTKVNAPIIFNLSDTEPPAIRMTMLRPQRTTNARTGERGVILPFQAVGPSANQVQAGRIFVSQAVDDTDAVLKSSELNPAFYHSTSGGIDDQSSRSSRQPISVDVMGLSANAKAIKAFDGRLELFVPTLDPNATVTVARVSSTLGRAINDPLLQAAGVTLVVYDKTTAEQMAKSKTANGPQDFDGAKMFGEDYLDPSMEPAVAKSLRDAQRHAFDNYPPAFAEEMRKSFQMGEHELAVGRSDPQNRVIEMEFQNADGSPIIYDHNGRYHSERTSEKKWFDTFYLPSALPPDAKLVCWLLTKNSVMSVPLKFQNFPLPPDSKK